MLLNHDRKTPYDWDDAVPSLCPDCGGPLIPRRGPILVHHWAHKAKPRAGSAPGCSATETPWHLCWKYAYHGLPNWEIEVAGHIDGKTYRFDAANKKTRRVREFVHSLSDTYVAKHLAIKSRPVLEALWIFDGDQFAAARRKPVRNGGFKHLLKPRARWLYAQLVTTRGKPLVHFDGMLWKEWQNDVWYPLEGDVSDDLLDRHVAAMRKLRAEQDAADPFSALVPEPACDDPFDFGPFDNQGEGEP